MCPDAGCSIEGLGVEFPHIWLVGIGDSEKYFDGVLFVEGGDVRLSRNNNQIEGH